jgi:cyclopropane fatty-acyl-phospholipid synthase-like methyltransferase
MLELGCASGGNLIPMAFNLPDGEFVGIDLSRRHVDAALSTMRALGMRNIRIAHGSILDIDESWGLFDYVICHGVFSWHVRARMGRFAARLTAGSCSFVETPEATWDSTGGQRTCRV